MFETKEATEQSSKEQFKAEVGVSFSTPVGVSGSVKHKEEKGASAETKSTEITKNESNVFEAVGGDTILAAAPAAWAATVPPHQNWRVINRDGLVPLQDMITATPGYGDVRSLFIQAVPSLSKYIELSSARDVITRLRLTYPLNNLSLSKVDKTSEAYYLGYDPNNKVTPRQMSVHTNETSHLFWREMVEYTDEIPLFSPATSHQPVLLGIKDNALDKDKKNEFGNLYDENFTNAMWSITVPFSDSLCHGARVVLRTVPFTEPPTPKPEATKPLGTTQAGATGTSETTQPREIPPPPPSYFAVVYRNQQGVFLPGMSDTEEPQYWRILKRNGQKMGEQIKEGDEIRFCWAFSDQTTGFRDYYQDVFGRRRNQIPDELQDVVLYLKVPWPRFQSAVSRDSVTGLPFPCSMLMSPDPSLTEVYMDINVLPGKGTPFKYVVQDVSFRIDTVPNQSRGDSEDYMMRVKQEDRTMRTILGEWWSVWGRPEDRQWLNTKIAIDSFYL